MRHRLLAIAILSSLKILAQPQNPEWIATGTPIPVEAMIGQRSGFYQHVISKNILKDKYNFFNVSSFDSKWGDNQDNHFIISNFLSRNIGKGFGVGIGAEIQGPGSFLTLGGQYSCGSKKLLLVLFPTININGPKEYSHFSLIEYKPKLGPTLHAYLKLQFLLTTNFNKLTRSYQQLRIGMEKSHIVFGLAINLDQFQALGLTKENYGIFIKMPML